MISSKSSLWIVLFCLCLFIPNSAPCSARNKTILFLSSSSETPGHVEMVRQEIDVLLKSRFDMDYQILDVDFSSIEKAEALLTTIFNDHTIDCVIGTSLDASEALVRWKHYSKPVVAGAILDRKLQGLAMTADGTSGVSNFNYIQSPFDIEKDLKTFRKLKKFKHLAVLYNPTEVYMFHYFFGYLGKVLPRVSPDARFSLIEVYPDNIEGFIEAMPDDVDAVYLPPLFMDRSEKKHAAIIQLLNNKKLPSFALLGEMDVQLGAMASIAPDQNINAVSRRIALNVLNMLSGQDGGDLPISVVSYNDNFVVNMKTLRQIDYYPPWDALNDARLVNMEAATPGSKISIRSVILEALENNLDLKIEKMNTQIQRSVTDAAKSSLWPQLTVSSSVNMLDENRADGEQGSPARYTWLLSGKLSQTLFSDDLLANYAIQQTLTRAQKYQELTTVLDTVVNAAEAFINLLFAETNRVIQNDNLTVTRKNLDIAKNKEAVGSGSSSEVYRWQSEQANNQISLNDSHRDFQLARMVLNRLLNRPIRENIKPEDIVINESIELLVTDPEVFAFLQNFKDLSRFSDFMTREADSNLPELQQIEATIAANTRELLNRKRAYYLPDLQLQGAIDKTLEEYDVYSDTPSYLDHPWSLYLVASWPLFDGFKRSHELQQSKVKLQQAKTSLAKLRQQLHLQVRSNLETAAVSAREVDLSQIRLNAATKNFGIIQAGYSQGRNSIADLIDAQNAKLNAEQGYAIAKYQFVLDFLLLERSAGRFHFLSTPTEKDAFLSRLSKFMNAPAQ